MGSEELFTQGDDPMRTYAPLALAVLISGACNPPDNTKTHDKETKDTAAPPKSEAQKPDVKPTPSGDKVVIQYDCIPNYANWGGVTAKYKEVSGVTVPPDDKGSSVAKAALEKEKDAPVADVVYYSGAIGYAAAKEGLHQPYKPSGWEKVPDGLKD